VPKPNNRIHGAVSSGINAKEKIRTASSAIMTAVAVQGKVKKYSHGFYYLVRSTQRNGWHFGSIPPAIPAYTELTI
jgi:predicted molibdopterin-dependent oxidoreductase YjgC